MALPFINNPVDGDRARAALDFFGVDPSGALDLAGARDVPITRTRTSHALLIRVAGGRVVGACNGFSHTQTRNVEEEFEVGVGARGYSPADMVPQNVTGRTLSIQRYDLFQRPCEEAFGTGFEYTSLADQRRPFTLRTIWRSPVSSVLGGRRVYEYTGCYFTRFGRTARTTDDRIVNVDAEIAYQDRRRVA